MCTFASFDVNDHVKGSRTSQGLGSLASPSFEVLPEITVELVLPAKTMEKTTICIFSCLCELLVCCISFGVWFQPIPSFALAFALRLKVHLQMINSQLGFCRVTLLGLTFDKLLTKDFLFETSNSCKPTNSLYYRTYRPLEQTKRNTTPSINHFCLEKPLILLFFLKYNLKCLIFKRTDPVSFGFKLFFGHFSQAPQPQATHLHSWQGNAGGASEDQGTTELRYGHGRLAWLDAVGFLLGQQKKTKPKGPQTQRNPKKTQRNPKKPQRKPKENPKKTKETHKLKPQKPKFQRRHPLRNPKPPPGGANSWAFWRKSLG